MPKQAVATCPKCGNQSWLIFWNWARCAACEHDVLFRIPMDAKELVTHINGGEA
jgi:hypothetical protein